MIDKAHTIIGGTLALAAFAFVATVYSASVRYEKSRGILVSIEEPLDAFCKENGLDGKASPQGIAHGGGPDQCQFRFAGCDKVVVIPRALAVSFGVYVRNYLKAHVGTKLWDCSSLDDEII